MKKGILVTVAVVVVFGFALARADSPGGLLQKKKPNVNYIEFTHFAVPASPVPIGNKVADVTAVAFGVVDSGCDPTDFAGFPAGNIALVSRGYCTFALKVLNAMAAGATGVLIANNLPGPPITISLSNADVGVPVLFITQDLGATFASDALLRVHMLVRNPVEE